MGKLDSDHNERLHTFLALTAQRHDHVCPRQVLGVRMGMLAGQILGIELPQTRKRLVTLVETDGCFADGIAVATGCEFGHRTLRLVDYGKVAAVFIDTRTDRAVRIYPHYASRENARALAPEAHSRWHAYLEAYQTMPDDALLVVQDVQLTFSVSEMMSRPIKRIDCEGCGEEIINEREVVVDGRVLCQSCANGGYYVLAGTPIKRQIKIWP